MTPGFPHNIRLSLRVLARSKVYTSINLSGLVLGLTVSFILLIFAVNELSYNDCFSNAGRIFRVLTKDDGGNRYGLGPYMLKPAIDKQFSQIEHSARLINLNNLLGNISVRGDSVCEDVPDFYCADPDLAYIFDLKLIRGRSGGVMISRTTAGKFFHGLSPIGKSLTVTVSGASFKLPVSAVFEDLPWNSTIRASIIAGTGFYREVLRLFYANPDIELASAGDYSAQTFLLLKPGAKIQEVEAGMGDLAKLTGSKPGSFVFQQFSDAYLQSGDIGNDFIAKGSKQNLVIYLSLSVFILFLASVNYSLLGTARSALRFKEIGVRKVLGATRGNLRTQLLTESVILAVIAFPLSYLLIGLVDPVVEQWFGYSLHLTPASLFKYLVISSIITVIIGLVSGLSAAIYLSGLNPVTALKSNYVIYKKISLSKIFIIFQVFITLALFAGLINVWLQIRLCLDPDQGIPKENLLIASFTAEDSTLYGRLKKTVQDRDDVVAVSGSSIRIPTAGGKTLLLRKQGNNARIAFEQFLVDAGFFGAIGAGLEQGRDFGAGDTAGPGSVIINGEAAKILGNIKPGLTTINGKTIIGVARDFNIHSLHRKIGPMLFELNPSACRSLAVRYQAGRGKEISDALGRAWQKISRDIPLEQNFYDRELRAQYAGEENFGRVVGTFTLLAFAITGMGLFGLAILIAERRLKEMSIRKVFGASRFNIIYLIQKEFIVYILVAAAVALPVAWYFLAAWLEQFYYRITLQWYVFLFSVLAVAFFVSLILFLKTLRILRENPANALKYE
jgi:putative ABC transport system permease protein